MMVAVCEDLGRDADRLRVLLERYRLEKQLDIEIALYGSGEALLCDFAARGAQVVLLDVGLGGGMDGIEAAKKLREIDRDCAIIFITISKEYALQSYAVRAAHYLVKPVGYEEFSVAMGRCEKQIERFSRYIEVMENRAPVRILLRDILYAEVFRKSCVIHTKKGRVNAYLAIDELEKQLMSGAFLRCHRSYIVNMNRVRAMRDFEFVLEGGGRAFISRRMRPAVQKAYYDYTLAQAQSESIE